MQKYTDTYSQDMPPLVSVVIITYCQEKYIRQALDSVLMQHVNFAFEMIVADDCSSDATPEIIHEYEQKHSFVHGIYRTKNLGASKNYMEAVLLAKGSYIVVFEGDDYWLDATKLQQQVDFLQAHPDYLGVSHVLALRDDTAASHGFQPCSKKILDKDATLPLFLRGISFSCMATMYRNIFLQSENVTRYYDYITSHKMVADFPLCVLFLQLGRIYVMHQPLSVYRVSSAISSNTTSYNTTHRWKEKYQDFLTVLHKSESFWNGTINFGTLYLTGSFYSCVESILSRQFFSFLSMTTQWPLRAKLLFAPYFVIKSVSVLYYALQKRLKRCR